MTKLYIMTQYIENYGDEDSPYWKSKGGYDYFVLNVSESDVESIMSRAREKIEHSNPFSHEYVIGYRIVADDFITRDEELQMEYCGKITFSPVVVEV